jgi:hypothetical protein
VFDLIDECCCFTNQSSINTIKNKLHVTFMSLRIIVYLVILAFNLSCLLTDSYRSSMFILSESNLCGTHGINSRQKPLSGCQMNLLSDLSCWNI